MKQTRGFISLLLFVSFSLIATGTIFAQDSKAALQRGYRTGYSDGYMAGYRDAIDNAAKDIRRHSEYSEAKRAYNKDYGTLEDYSDGYRQGFESGYDTGFEKRSFESAVPLTLSKRGSIPIAAPVAALQQPQAVQPAPLTEPAEEANTAEAESFQPETSEPAPAAPVQPTIQKAAYTAQTDDPIIIIPRDTELIIEIQEPISTETSRAGDKFTAKIVSPYEITGAMIEGRIERITKPGRLKRRAELLLTFDRIVLNDERWSNYSAIVTEVLPIKGDNVQTVDNEGAAIGKRSIKEDAIKVGATTGAGLGIGALTAGPVGAAVGAGVGAAFGVGAVVIERGKHIQINQNQQLRIRTAYETKIR
jgi:hypothetical protein